MRNRNLPRTLPALAAALAISTLSVTTTLAAPAYVEVDRWSDEVRELGIGEEACLASSNLEASLTLVSSGTAGYRETATGYQLMAAVHGTFTLDPVDPALPTYTGSFARGYVFSASWASGELRELFSDRLVLNGTAPDGSRMVSVVSFHAGLTPSGAEHGFVRTACGG